jgi:tetratricopeptide (TPR) repeat protein
MLSYQWNWVEAEKSIRRAIDLNPGYAGAYTTYGRALSFMGRHDEALVQLEKARGLNPLSPIVLAYTAQVHIFAKRYAEAEKILNDALLLHANHALLLHNLGELYTATGKYQQAIEPLKQSAETSASLHYKAVLALAYARAGQRGQAMVLLDEINKAPANQFSPFNLAFVYLGLGNKERALQLLEQAYEQQDVWMKEIKAWPWFDELKNEKRFRDLLQKMNFP